MPLTYSWNTITAAQADADSIINETLTEGWRQNAIVLYEWLGGSYTPTLDHDHNGVNSKAIAFSIDETDIDWANSNGICQSVMDMSTFNTAGTGSYVEMTRCYIYIPPNANTIEFKYETRIVSGATATFKFVVDGGDSGTSSETFTTFQLKAVTKDISASSGWVLVSVQTTKPDGASEIRAMSYRIY